MDLPKGTIPHGSRLKIRLQNQDGWVADRLPAWTPYAIQQKDGVLYDAVHWSPSDKAGLEIGPPCPWISEGGMRPGVGKGASRGLLSRRQLAGC